MGAAAKIIIGLVIISLGFGLFVDSVYDNRWTSWTGMQINWWGNFITVLTGIIPALLILIGLFVVWLEADEIKAEREIKAEETPTEEVKKAVKSTTAKKTKKKKR